MGRLTPEKGFDRLLDAFARCSHAHPSWLLQIVGEGPERQICRPKLRVSVLVIGYAFSGSSTS